jgi:DNA-binding transcriptional MerR regulator
MATWYVKELSKLMKVSVRTLHYYDKIGLLKPSGRLSNGYRVYYERDVRKLEKILVLKFFGFTLSHIQMLLQHDNNTLKYLHSQLQIVQEEVSYLENTQRKLLARAIKELETNHLVNWGDLAKLIESYDKTDLPAWLAKVNNEPQEKNEDQDETENPTHSSESSFENENR